MGNPLHLTSGDSAGGGLAKSGLLGDENTLNARAT